MGALLVECSMRRYKGLNMLVRFHKNMLRVIALQIQFDIPATPGFSPALEG